MELIGITDIHSYLPPMEELGPVLRKADVLIVSGDITHFGGAAEADRVISSLKKYQKNILAVPGNCDLDEVYEVLDQHDMNLHGTSHITGELAFTGLGGSLPCPGKTPGEFTDDEMGRILRRALDELPENRRQVLVSHQPPLNTSMDRLTSGEHVGSASVRAYIEENRPLICFTGHIHEAQGTDELNGTLIVNPGPLKYGHYAYARIQEDRVEDLEIRTWK